MKNLGKKAKDKVSGMKGILTSRIIYLNGCIQYGLTPKYDPKTGNGKYPDSTWIDEGQIEILPTGEVIPKSNAVKEKKSPGGSQVHLPR